MKKWIPLIVVLVAAAVIVIVSTRGGKKHETSEATPKDSVQFKTEVYMENSGSMDGYVTINSEFKDALEHLLIMLNDRYGAPNLSFINQQIIDSTGIDEDVTRFARQLSPKNIHVGDRGSSNINDIFRMILGRTDDKTVSVLVSDCVYSIQGNDAQSLLNNQKNLTENSFIQGIKQNKGDLATIILQCSSKYNGYYYDMNNTEIRYEGRRPYYIIFMGRTRYLRDIYNHLDLTPNGIEGLMNTYAITSLVEHLNDTNSSIITDEHLLRNVDRLEPARREVGIKSIMPSAKTFTIAMGIDASAFFVDHGYLTDPTNYDTDPKTVKVVSVQRVDPHSAAIGDCPNFAKPYSVQLQFTGSPSHVRLSLGYRLPKWVYDTSTNDDTHGIPAENVTFGISYMMEGINNAFKQKNAAKSVFDIDFDIEAYK